MIPLFLAGAALSVAFVSQYAFDTHPCHLCLLQRYPYAAAIMLSLIGLCWAKAHRLLNALIILCFVITAAIAFYHVGVEQGWVSGPDSCTASLTQTGSLEELKASILNAPLVSCADVGASFLGLSMAAWNALYASICALVCGRLFMRKPV